MTEVETPAAREDDGAMGRAEKGEGKGGKNGGATPEGIEWKDGIVTWDGKDDVRFSLFPPLLPAEGRLTDSNSFSLAARQPEKLVLPSSIPSRRLTRHNNQSVFPPLTP
jgi:hypothetical protein